MNISIVAAMGTNRVIGKDNKLPWDLPADKEHLYKIIAGKTVLMGRKTYESIGHPLANCRNLVVSQDEKLQLSGCEVYPSTHAALAAVKSNQEVIILGGEKIYAEFLPLAKRMYLTIIYHDFIGDTFFPEWNPAEWEEIAREPFAAAENLYAYDFVIYQRRS